MRGLYIKTPHFRRLLLDFHEGQEGFLRHFHKTNHLHLLLAFFLFFQEFPLAGDVAAIAFGHHVLSHGENIRTGDNLGADGCLQEVS